MDPLNHEAISLAELRHSALPNLYQNLVNHARDVIRNAAPSQYHTHRLAELDACVRKYQNGKIVSRFLLSWEYRKELLQILSKFGISNNLDIQDADENIIQQYIRTVLDSPRSSEEVLSLQGKDADRFMCILQNSLDNMSAAEGSFSRDARYFLIKLATRSLSLPMSLFISDVELQGPHPVVGGGYADVFLGVYHGRVVALKRMRIYEEPSSQKVEMAKTLFREAAIWQGLNHENILPFLGVDKECFPPLYSLVSPWMRRGHIVKHSEQACLSSRRIANLLYQVAHGLRYLHGCGVVHGDLKGSNVFIDDDGRACLADFGLARMVNATRTSSITGGGSTKWMAPELLLPFGEPDHAKTAFSSDVFAYACVCLEVFTGKPPFPELHDGAVVLEIHLGRRPSRPTISGCSGRELSDALWGLMQACWLDDRSARPSTDSIISMLEKEIGHGTVSQDKFNAAYHEATSSSSLTDAPRGSFSRDNITLPVMAINPGLNISQPRAAQMSIRMSNMTESVDSANVSTQSGPCHQTPNISNERSIHHDADIVQDQGETQNATIAGTGVSLSSLPRTHMSSKSQRDKEIQRLQHEVDCLRAENEELRLAGDSVVSERVSDSPMGPDIRYQMRKASNGEIPPHDHPCHDLPADQSSLSVPCQSLTKAVKRWIQRLKRILCIPDWRAQPPLGGPMTHNASPPSLDSPPDEERHQQEEFPGSPSLHGLPSLQEAPEHVQFYSFAQRHATSGDERDVDTTWDAPEGTSEPYTAPVPAVQSGSTQSHAEPDMTLSDPSVPNNEGPARGMWLDAAHESEDNRPTTKHQLAAEEEAEELPGVNHSVRSTVLPPTPRRDGNLSACGVV